MTLPVILLCRNYSSRLDTPVPCGICDGCRQSASLRHPNLKILFPTPKPKEASEASAAEYYTDAQQKKIDDLMAQKAEDLYTPLRISGGQEIYIEHIRALRREFCLTSFSGAWRVVLVSQADRLRAQAANAFLKLLEEPPKGVVFLLTTDRETKVLPTIVSRCQQLRFAPLPSSLIAEELIQRHQLTPENANAAARLSGGSWRKAHEWVDADPTARMQKVVEVFRIILKFDPGEIDELTDKLTTAAAINDLGVILSLMTAWLRDVQRYDADPVRHVDLEHDQTLVRFARFCEGRDFARAIEEIESARLLIERRVQPPLVMQRLLMRIRHILFDRSRATA